MYNCTVYTHNSYVVRHYKHAMRRERECGETEKLIQTTKHLNMKRVINSFRLLSCTCSRFPRINISSPQSIAACKSQCFLPLCIHTTQYQLYTSSSHSLYLWNSLCLYIFDSLLLIFYLLYATYRKWILISKMLTLGYGYENYYY